MRGGGQGFLAQANSQVYTGIGFHGHRVKAMFVVRSFFLFFFSVLFSSQKTNLQVHARDLRGEEGRSGRERAAAGGFVDDI